MSTTAVATVTAAPPTTWSAPQRVWVVFTVAGGILARWWALGSAGLSFDESFTAGYSSLPLSDIPGALRANDSHPPLDYVIRHFLVGAHSELLLRAPSALFSTLALLAVVVWMRHRSWFGVGVVGLFSLSSFQLMYGRQARMYALMTLLGVLVAMLAERWLNGDRRTRIVVATGALLTIACFDHVGGVLLAAGVFALAGFRTERQAWIWRAAPVVAVLIWGVLWGPSFLDQMRLGASSWIPTTSPTALDNTVNGMVTMMKGTRWTASLLVAAGGLALWAKDRTLGLLWAGLFLVPYVALAVLGLHLHVLLPRTLAASTWAVPLAWCAVAEWLWRRWAGIGMVLTLLFALVTLRSVHDAVSYDEGDRPPMAVIDAAVAPGDGVAIHPQWFWPLAWWQMESGRGDTPPPALADADVWYSVRPGAASTGRTWFAESKDYLVDTTRWPSCGEPRPIGGDWELACVVTGGS